VNPSGSARPADAPTRRGAAARGLAFGSYRLDPSARRLLRDGREAELPVRQFDVLYVLASRAGETVGREELTAIVWPKQFISESSLTNAVAELRATLDPGQPDRYIVTEKGRGYRFIAPVSFVEAPAPAVDVEALLAPHRALTDGRVALESMDRRRLADARRAFEILVAHHPADARFHVGLANACVLQFEATRAELEPDMAALSVAEEHAGLAIAFAPESGEAWATLGFVLERTGARDDGLAALSRAIALESGNRFHHLRLASASWGEARLRAVRSTLALAGEAPLARVLGAMVFVARNRAAEAQRELDAAAVRIEMSAGEPARVVAVDWLRGQLALARGAIDEALEGFARERVLEPHGHVYAKECAAQAWYATGACHLARGNTDGAREAFGEAIARVPQHLAAHAGLMLAGGQTRAGLETFAAAMSADAAIARGIVLVARGEAARAAEIVGAALASAPPGNAGWLIPIEPLLHVRRDEPAWAKVIATLGARAS
jgi:DNA-binding winged helix-turn-helix (wHTH) protein